MDSKHTILVIDDEEDIRQSLQNWFELEGFNVVTAEDIIKGIDEAKRGGIDLAIVDINMPIIGMGPEMERSAGYFVARKIREFSNIPLILYSGKPIDSNALGNMYDYDLIDYLPKNVTPDALSKKLKAMIRRKESEIEFEEPKPNEQTLFTTDDGSLCLDINNRKGVKVGNDFVALTTAEFDILHFLMKKRGIPCTAEEIHEKLWVAGGRRHGELSTVKQHISNLRSKIDANREKPEYLPHAGNNYFVANLKKKES